MCIRDRIAGARIQPVILVFEDLQWFDPTSIDLVNALSARSALAAVNFSSHFVVSAPRPELEEIEAALKTREVAYQRLPVSFPFHSPWIDDAHGPFEAFMRSIRHTHGRVPLVCCAEAETPSLTQARPPTCGGVCSGCFPRRRSAPGG